MFDHATASLRLPTPASLADDQPDARRWQRPQHEAYALYVRLYWLLHDLPRGHPACQPLAAAVDVANAHWRALTPDDGLIPNEA
jgi:hypothetical protein